MRTFQTPPGESNAQNHFLDHQLGLVHNAGEECRNSNVKGDAAETGLQNGNGQITRREAPNPGEATLAGRCGELLFFAWPASENDSRVFREHRRERTSDIVSRFGSHEC